MIPQIYFVPPEILLSADNFLLKHIKIENLSPLEMHFSPQTVKLRYGPGFPFYADLKLNGWFRFPTKGY